MTLEQTRKSKYRVFIGWALTVYCESKTQLDEIIYRYGKDKVKTDFIGR